MSVHSADTSISSVATEPHPEPTPRRRLSPASCNVSSSHMAFPSTDVSSATAAAPTAPTAPVRKQNNPYMYNVLGENASPELAARTSPIPRSPSPPMNGSVTSWGGEEDNVGGHPMGNTTQPAMAEYGTYDPQLPKSHSFHHHTHHQHQPQGAVRGQLGGYMAVAYKSAFPPGHLPAPTGPDGSAEGYAPPPHDGATSATTASSRSSPVSRGPSDAAPPANSGKSRRHRNRRPSPVTAPSPTVPSPVEPRSPVSPSPVQSPTSPMTRVYRNGRPIPVPAATQ